MAAEYSFEKKSIFILVFSVMMLLILVYFLGMLTGLSMERSETKTNVQRQATEPAKPGNDEASAPTADGGQIKRSDLSKETETKPVTPEFKEVSPQAEQPGISQPKKE